MPPPSTPPSTPPTPPSPPSPPGFPSSLVCTPTRNGAASAECGFAGSCSKPGHCFCFEGRGGETCDEAVGHDGSRVKLLPENHVATVTFVWGMAGAPLRTLDGKPTSASFDAEAPLLTLTAQRLITRLCAYLETAPAYHVRARTLQCPMLELMRTRQDEALPWPVPEAEALGALAKLARTSESAAAMMGVVADAEQANGVRLAWVGVRVKTNVPVEGGSTAQLKLEAEWFEGLVQQVNREAAAAGLPTLRGWQSSEAWVWSEALSEAVSGTAGCVVSGGLLTMATLLLLTGSLAVSGATSKPPPPEYMARPRLVPWPCLATRVPLRRSPTRDCDDTGSGRCLCGASLLRRLPGAARLRTGHCRGNRHHHLHRICLRLLRTRCAGTLLRGPQPQPQG